MSLYPTATERLLYPNIVKRRDAMYCLNIANQCIGFLLRGEIDSLEMRLRAATIARTNLESSRHHNLTARALGFKLPG